jgi:hypothetical protein
MPLNSASVMLAIWLLLSAAVPLLSVTYWPLVYMLYVALGVAAFAALAQGGRQQRFPVLIVIKLAFLLLLMAVHNASLRTVINIGAIAFADIIIGLFVMTQGTDYASLRRMLVRLRLLGFFVIIVGIGLGPVFASIFGLDDPIADLLAGKRVRIFSDNFGHSVMIDFAVLMLILAVSNFAREGRVFRGIMVALSLAMAYFARSSIGYIGVGVVLGVAVIEWLPIPSRARNVIHVAAVAGGIFLSTTMSDDIVFQLRDFQTGGNAAVEYRYHDLTAGRALLNSELQQIADDYPVFGAGTEVSLLQDGLVRNGVKMAMSESSLRIAAKYGWIFYGVVLLVIASPLLVLRLRDRPTRILALALTYYLVDVFAFNSLFEVPHDSRYFWMLPLLVLVGSHCMQAARRPIRAITMAARVEQEA